MLIEVVVGKIGFHCRASRSPAQFAIASFSLLPESEQSYRLPRNFKEANANTIACVVSPFAFCKCHMLCSTSSPCPPPPLGSSTCLSTSSLGGEVGLGGEDAAVRGLFAATRI